jgi:hypothetical protein
VRNPATMPPPKVFMRQKHNFGGNNMTRTLLILAGSLLVAPAAWAMDAPSQPGGGNAVNSQFRTPPPAAEPAAAPSTGTTISHSPTDQMPTFNPNAYGSASDCMTAAYAAHQPLGPCEGLRT